MSYITVDLPNKIHFLWKKELSYNDFINFLSKKSILDDIKYLTIETEGVEAFECIEERNLMNLKSVKSLFNTL